MAKKEKSEFSLRPKKPKREYIGQDKVKEKHENLHRSS